MAEDSSCSKASAVSTNFLACGRKQKACIATEVCPFDKSIRFRKAFCLVLNDSLESLSTVNKRFARLRS